MVPGVDHCSGGPGPSVVNWVDEGLPEPSSDLAQLKNLSDADVHALMRVNMGRFLGLGISALSAGCDRERIATATRGANSGIKVRGESDTRRASRYSGRTTEEAPR